VDQFAWIAATAVELLLPQNLGGKHCADFEHRAKLVANIDSDVLIGLSFHHDPDNSIGERSDALLMRSFDILEQPTFLVYRNDITRS
jgi:hypothetical protein